MIGVQMYWLPTLGKALFPSLGSSLNRRENSALFVRPYPVYRSDRGLHRQGIMILYL